MSAIDDHLLFSEGRVTDATLSMDPTDPNRSLIQAILALVEVMHAQTLPSQEDAIAVNRVPFEQHVEPHPGRWCPKMLTEKLCAQQVLAPDDFTRHEIGRLINVLALHRPTGSNGKHGNLHTPTCGCEDK